ncbi:hypothetical protein CspHIS471_0409280 [Cutaneotrichosporon sp. HIS471]|nr:hypothetical protein CspHIS471_0409280 [Cutaneotrichosporon sp. HIS471]
MRRPRSTDQLQIETSQLPALVAEKPVWFDAAFDAGFTRTVQPRLDAIEARLVRLDRGMRQLLICRALDERVGAARAANSNIHFQEPLCPLPKGPQEPANTLLDSPLPSLIYPESFPASSYSLGIMKAREVDALLEFYNLEVDGSLDQRKLRLAAHIGLHLNSPYMTDRQ